MKNDGATEKLVAGFSKKSKAEKIAWISEQFSQPEQAKALLDTYAHPDSAAGDG